MEMASDSKKTVGSSVTKEIESRIKQAPDHLFEAFLEIREPVENETSAILCKYPTDYSDDILKTVVNFAYPCQIPSDEQSEHFAFVILDRTGTLFRFGYCRRSNREATCLCIISYYPWFEIFYTILNDLSQIINAKATADLEQFLSALYDYKLLSNDEFYLKEGKETIEIKTPSKNYTYVRPDPRKLPSMLTSRNFTVMYSRLGPEIMLNLFSHLLFERRILLVSSKLFHLTACAYGCLHLIHPMHWQSIFLPILPASMLWTTQCTAPYIIGIHSSLFATLNMSELGDVVVVNIDERKLETHHDDLNSFPKYLTRSMKKGIQQSSQLPGDHLARVFLRAMAFTIGNYANGFTFKNEKLDFDRDLYLEQYLGSHIHSFMSAVAHTQLFEQFSRYRTYAQLQRETDVDEFDLEVKQLRKLQQSKKFKTNKKIYKLLEKYVKDGRIVSSDTNRTKEKKRTSLIDTKDERNKAANPLLEQVQTKAEKFQTAMNKAGQRVASEASSVRNNLTSLDRINGKKKTNESTVTSTIKPTHQSSNPDLLREKIVVYERFTTRDDVSSPEPHLINGDQLSSSSSSSSRSSTPDLNRDTTDALINFDSEENPLLTFPITVDVIQTPLATPNLRSGPQIDPKIKQKQNELQNRVQTFNSKRLDPRDDYGEQQTEIKKLFRQFDPLDDANYTSRSRKPSEPTFSSMPVTLRNEEKPSSAMADRHPSIYETIPINHVHNALQNIRTNYGTHSRMPFRPTYSMQQQRPESNHLMTFSPASTAPASLFPRIVDDSIVNFDPLAPSNEESLVTNVPSTGSNDSNLIDFN